MSSAIKFEDCEDLAQVSEFKDFEIAQKNFDYFQESKLSIKHTSVHEKDQTQYFPKEEKKLLSSIEDLMSKLKRANLRGFRLNSLDLGEIQSNESESAEIRDF